MNRPTPPAADDLLCETCGYTLNGLPLDGNCPECGTPVAASTTQTPRRPPAWETAGGSAVSRFNRTAGFVALHPGLFGRRVSINGDTAKSARFSRIALAIAAYLNAKTIIVHFTLIGLLSFRYPLSLLVTALVAAFASFVAWRAILELVAWLTSLESGFWGHRMPRLRVLRLLHYLSIQLVVASAFPLLATTAAAVMFAYDNNNGRFAVQYLYGLCVVMVATAIYVFMVYWRTMKAVLYANDEAVVRRVAAVEGQVA